MRNSSAAPPKAHTDSECARVSEGPPAQVRHPLKTSVIRSRGKGSCTGNSSNSSYSSKRRGPRASKSCPSLAAVVRGWGMLNVEFIAFYILKMHISTSLQHHGGLVQDKSPPSLQTLCPLSRPPPGLGILAASWKSEELR